MSSKIFNPKMDPADESVPIMNGGTGARLKEDACENLGLVSRDQIRQPNGIIVLGQDGLIQKEDLPSNLVNIGVPSFSGEHVVGLNATLKIYITNYSTDVDYVMTFSGGVATRDADLVTFVGGSTVEDGWVEINGRRFDIYVGPPRALQPIILWPSVDHRDEIGPVLTLLASDFVAGELGDSHLSSVWEFYRDPDLTSLAIAKTVLTPDLTQLTLNDHAAASVYYARVRYFGSNGAHSKWSPVVSFTTRETFMPVVYSDVIESPSGGRLTGGFGYSIDLSEDGKTLVAGGVRDPSDRGGIHILTQNEDRGYDEEAVITTQVNTGEVIQLHLDIPVGGHVSIAADAIGWATTNYTSTADVTIPVGVSVLSMTGYGTSTTPSVVYMGGDVFEFSGTTDTTKTIYVTNNVLLGISSAVSGDGLVVAGGAVGYAERGKTIDVVVPSGGVVSLTTNSSALPSASYTGNTTVNLPQDATRVTFNGRGSNGAAEMSIAASSRAFVGVGGFQYNKYITSLRITAKGGNLGTVWVPQVGLPQYPSGLPAYVAPVAAVKVWTTLSATTKSRDISVIINENTAWDYVAAEPAIPFTVEPKTQDATYPTASSYVATIGTGFSVVVDGSNYYLTKRTKSAAFDGGKTDVYTYTLTEVTFTLVQVSAAVAQVGLPDYPSGLPNYVAGHNETASSAPVGSVYNTVGSPDYPTGLPAYVAATPGVFKWVPTGSSFVVKTGSAEDNVNINYNPSSIDYGISSSDELTQSGSYNTAEGYATVLIKKHPSFTGIGYSAQSLTYHSTTIAADGKSGTILYSENGYDNSGDNTYYWQAKAIVTFSLIQVSAPTAVVGVAGYPSGLPAYAAVYAGTNGSQTTSVIHHPQVGLPAYPSGLPAYVAAKAEVAEWCGYGHFLDQDPVFIGSCPYSSYPSPELLRDYLNNYYPGEGIVSGSTVTMYSLAPLSNPPPPFINHAAPLGYDECAMDNGIPPATQVDVAVFTPYIISPATAQIGLPAYPAGLPPYVAAYDETFSSIDTVISIGGKTLTFSGEGGTTVYHPQVGLPAYPQGLLPYVAPVAAVNTWTVTSARTTRAMYHDENNGIAPVNPGAKIKDLTPLPISTTNRTQDATYPTAAAFAASLGSGYSASISGNTGTLTKTVIGTAYIDNIYGGDGSYWVVDVSVSTITFTLVQTTAAVAQQGLPAYPTGLPVYVAAYSTYTPGPGGITIHTEQVGFPGYPSGLSPYVAPVSEAFTWVPSAEQRYTVFRKATGGAWEQSGIVTTEINGMSPSIHSLASTSTYPTISSAVDQIFKGRILSFTRDIRDASNGSTSQTLTASFKDVIYPEAEAALMSFATSPMTVYDEEGVAYSEYCKIDVVIEKVRTTASVAQVGLPQLPGGLPPYAAAYDSYIAGSEATATSVTINIRDDSAHNLFYAIPGSGSCQVETYLTSVASEKFTPETLTLSGEGEVYLPFGLPSFTYVAAGAGEDGGGLSTIFYLDSLQYTFNGNASAPATQSTATIALDNYKRHVVRYAVPAGGSLTLLWGDSQAAFSDVPATNARFTVDGVYYANSSVRTMTVAGYGSKGYISPVDWIDMSTSSSTEHETYALLDSVGRLLHSTDRGLSWEELLPPTGRMITVLNHGNTGELGPVVLLDDNSLSRYNTATNTWETTSAFDGQLHPSSTWVAFYFDGVRAVALSTEGDIISQAHGTLSCPVIDHTWTDITVNPDTGEIMVLATDGYIACFNGSWRTLASTPQLSGSDWKSLSYADGKYYALRLSRELKVSDGITPWVASYNVTPKTSTLTNSVTPAVMVGMSSILSASMPSLAVFDIEGNLQIRQTKQSKWLFKADVGTSEDKRVLGASGTAVINGQTYVFPGADSTTSLVGVTNAPLTSYTVVIDGTGDVVPCHMHPNGGMISITHSSVAVSPDLGEPAKVIFPDQTLTFKGGVAGSTALTTRTVDLGATLLNANSLITSVKSGTNWELPKSLIGDIRQTTMFGTSISLDYTGRRMIVGAQLTNNAEGAAYIYLRTESGWSLEAQLTAEEKLPGDRYGNSVVISSDGRVAAVASLAAAGGRGPLHIYERQGTDWVLVDMLLRNDIVTWPGNVRYDEVYGDEYTESLAITADGGMLVVGMPGYARAGNAYAGAVGIVRRIGDHYSWDTILIPSETPTSNEILGFSVSVSSDGKIIAGGGKGASINGVVEAGRVYTWRRYLNDWVQDQSLIRNGGQTDLDGFGFSTELSGDGSVLAVSAPSTDTNVSGSGSIAIYYTS